MIDNIDKVLIQQLQRNGRESYINLAKMLWVSEGTVRKRIKQLLEQNMIRIVALPNMPKLGYGFVAIMGLQVKVADLRTVADALAKNKHVCYLAFVTGRYDLIAVLMIESPAQLSHLIEKEISTIPSVLRTEMLVTLEVIKGGWLGLDTRQLVNDIDVSTLKKVKRGGLPAGQT